MRKRNFVPKRFREEWTNRYGMCGSLEEVIKKSRSSGLYMPPAEVKRRVERTNFQCRDVQLYRAVWLCVILHNSQTAFLFLPLGELIMKITDIESKETGKLYELILNNYIDEGAFACIDLVGTDLFGMMLVSDAGLIQDMEDFVKVYEEHLLGDTRVWCNLQVADKEFGWIFYEWSPCGEVCAVMFWSPQRGYEEKKYVGEEFDGSVCAMAGKFCEEYLSK